MAEGGVMVNDQVPRAASGGSGIVPAVALKVRDMTVTQSISGNFS